MSHKCFESSHGHITFNRPHMESFNQSTIYECDIITDYICCLARGDNCKSRQHCKSSLMKNIGHKVFDESSGSLFFI